MIYLKNITDAQVVYLPKHSSGEVDGELVFTARSTIDLDTPVDIPVISINLSPLYYQIGVVLPSGLAAGEYEYTLLLGSESLSTGVMQIGEYDGVVTEEYDKTITYEQYNG